MGDVGVGVGEGGTEREVPKVIEDETGEGDGDNKPVTIVSSSDEITGISVDPSNLPGRNALDGKTDEIKSKFDNGKCKSNSINSKRKV